MFLLNSITLLTAIGSVVLPTAAQSTVRIMPLGDSITGSPGCWRAYLWQKLQAANIRSTDFVGTLPTQGCGFTYDGENEGHGGYLAINIANQNQLVGWLSQTKPDVVMMHLGTNDVWNNVATSQIITAFSKLVDQMRASKSTMKIIVAQIIPMTWSTCPTCGQRVQELNAAILPWAASKNSTASPITVVNLWTGFNTATDTGDGVHPNEAGGRKIADGWFPEVSRVIRSLG